MKNRNRRSVLDANETAFWKRELEHLKAQTYDVVYPGLAARLAFPVSKEGGSGITSITYQVWDSVGVAKIIGAYAKDIPRIDIKGTEVTVPVRRLADAFGLSLDEIRAAARVGRSLKPQKVIAAREGHEITLNNIAFNGDATHNLQGLFSHPNISNGAAPTGLWTGGTTTPAQILADLKAGFGYIRTVTSMAEMPNALLLPGSYYDHIAMTPLSDYSRDTTILDFLLQKIPYLSGPDSILPCNECEAVSSLAGASITEQPVATYYRKDKTKLELEVPEDINFLEPQREGLEEVTIVTMTTGGLNVYKPLSIYNQKMNT